MSFRILIAEDDPRVVDLVMRYCQKEGFLLLQASDGEQALELFHEHKPEMVILDLVLPRLNGSDVCAMIRKSSDVPIIMLTAKSDEASVLAGFARGADDYIAKPFNPRELIARVRALRRRASPGLSGGEKVYAGIVLNDNERKVYCDGQAVELTPLEFNLLQLFMENPRKVYSREELISNSHSSMSDSGARSIDFHIKNLRRKLNRDRSEGYITTVYGVGFRLEH